MSDRQHFADHRAPGCPRCLAGFLEAIGHKEAAPPVRAERTILIVRGDRAMVLRAA